VTVWTLGAAAETTRDVEITDNASRKNVEGAKRRGSAGRGVRLKR